ncbi:MAG: 50S ribosomal protein L15 [Deltaproteobacteria bacterium]|nr:MAG: 50S ribosomal protein L15 [Deltaproteobacteria bacterium]
MQLDSMKPVPGSRRKRKRVGRGPGSGHGKTAGRGHKGARSRSGHILKLGFEGGQMPLARRLPKRGFRNIFRVEYQVVNLGQLGRFEDGSIVDREALRQAGLCKGRRPIKVLAKGKLDRALTVRVDAFSSAAREAIAAAGGVAETSAKGQD